MSVESKPGVIETLSYDGRNVSLLLAGAGLFFSFGLTGVALFSAAATHVLAEDLKSRRLSPAK